MKPKKQSISKEDREHLAAYNRLRDLLRDRVVSVARRYQVGAYLVGRPGVGKTHGVQAALEGASGPFVYRNSRMSCMGLWRTLAEHADHTVVIDDIPSMYADSDSIQILMGALGGRAGEPRPVTYSTRDQQRSFYFSGGIIAISNVPLRRDRMADALASRMALLEFEPTEDMIRAFLKNEALKGCEDLGPEECLEVAEFVIEECRTAEYRLDLRYYYKALQDYRLARSGGTRHPWEELVRSSIVRVSVASPPAQMGRAEKKVAHREIARELFALYPDDRASREAEWVRLTGLSPKTLYRDAQYGQAVGP